MKPKLHNDGVITEDGRKLITWMEAILEPYSVPDAAANIQKLNMLSGPIKEWFALSRANQLSAVDWFKAFPNSAENAYDLMKYEEAQLAESQKSQETAQKTDDLTARLAKLEESLGAKVSELEVENARLLAENEALKAKSVASASEKKGTKKAETKAGADAETDEAETDAPAKE